MNGNPELGALLILAGLAVAIFIFGVLVGALLT